MRSAVPLGRHLSFSRFCAVLLCCVGAGLFTLSESIGLRREKSLFSGMGFGTFALAPARGRVYLKPQFLPYWSRSVAHQMSSELADELQVTQPETGLSDPPLAGQ